MLGLIWYFSMGFFFFGKGDAGFLFMGLVDDGFGFKRGGYCWNFWYFCGVDLWTLFFFFFFDRMNLICCCLSVVYFLCMWIVACGYEFKPNLSSAWIPFRYAYYLLNLSLLGYHLGLNLVGVLSNLHPLGGLGGREYGSMVVWVPIVGFGLWCWAL